MKSNEKLNITFISFPKQTICMLFCNTFHSLSFKLTEKGKKNSNNKYSVH